MMKLHDLKKDKVESLYYTNRNFVIYSVNSKRQGTQLGWRGQGKIKEKVKMSLGFIKYPAMKKDAVLY
jgi:hypothetical protein